MRIKNLAFAYFWIIIIYKHSISLNNIQRKTKIRQNIYRFLTIKICITELRKIVRLITKSILLQKGFNDFFNGNSFGIGFVIFHHTMSQNTNCDCFNILNIWGEFSVESGIGFGSQN